MTCAMRPQPITPTLNRRVILSPRHQARSAGTFHGTYTKPSAVSTSRDLTARAGQHARRLEDPLLRFDEGVLVLDRDRPDGCALPQQRHECRPPARVAPAADHGEVPRHLLRRPRP